MTLPQQAQLWAGDQPREEPQMAPAATAIATPPMGPPPKAFGPTTGRLLKSLEEGKIPPAAIDDIICSHGHIDHIGGLADDKGKRYFPNATVWITKADYDFWTDEGKLSGDLKPFIQHARQ